jgi:hypothetical protein
MGTIPLWGGIADHGKPSPQANKISTSTVSSVATTKTSSLVHERASL